MSDVGGAVAVGEGGWVGSGVGLVQASKAMLVRHRVSSDNRSRMEEPHCGIRIKALATVTQSHIEPTRGHEMPF